MTVFALIILQHTSSRRHTLWQNCTTSHWWNFNI